jgi:hypothetical protein
MVFVAILETSRRYSPANTIAETIGPKSSVQVVHQTTTRWWSADADAQQRRAGITIADYAIGGTVAGWAGALARRTALTSLTLTGLGFGIVAGCVQAASDAAAEYYYHHRHETKGSAAAAASEDDTADMIETVADDAAPAADVETSTLS